MITKNKKFMNEYVDVWDDGAEKDAPFITLGVEALLSDYYGNLLDSPPPFPVTPGSFVLDLGCGWGRVMKPVAECGASVLGMDISLKMLYQSRKHLKKNGYEPNLVRGDGTLLPFKNSSFDMAYSLLVLQHLSKENGEMVLHEISRILKPGGVAYIRVPGRFAPENILFSFLQMFSIYILRRQDPIRMRFYRLGEIRRKCRGLFSDISITAHEFRPPWNLHTKWTWQYILIPRRFHRGLRRISDKIETLANNRISFLKHFGVVLMVKVTKGE